MLSYVEQPIVPSPMIDSDRESNKSDDSDTVKQQRMYIWNDKYEVSLCVYSSLGFCFAVERWHGSKICDGLLVNERMNDGTVSALLWRTHAHTHTHTKVAA